MILQAILVGLVAGYGRIEQSWFGQQMIARPDVYKRQEFD